MSVIHFNKIYVIQSLFPQDYKSGKILYEDNLRWKESELENFSAEFIDIVDKDDLKRLFVKIKDEIISNNIYPILHFDMHGSTNGVELSNNDFISWWDLKNDLTDINVLTANNLFITMATCYGGFLYIILGTMERAPFFGLIGPLETIGSYDVSINFDVFYNELLTSFDFNEAIKKLNDSNATEVPYGFVNAETVFIKAWTHYSKINCSLTMIEKRIQRIAEKTSIHNALSKTTIKNISREWILKNKENHFYQFKEHFFMIDLYPENNERFMLQYEDVENV